MKRLLAMVIGMTCWYGCDKTPAPPPISSTQPQQASDDTSTSGRPTTQQLLTGQYAKLPLPDMPLSLRVPVSWKFDSAEALVLLEGPVPSSGDGVIQMASRRDPTHSDQLPASRFDAVMERLKKENDASPGPIKKFDLRTLGPCKLLERMYCSDPISTPRTGRRGETVVDAQGNAVLDTSTPVHWTITVYQPNGTSYDQYELNVIGMTTDQYASDKELYEKILGSLAVEATPQTMPAQNPQ